MAETRPCRCLLTESGQKPLAEVVAEYIAGLDESVRVGEAAYRGRLAVCVQCEHLRSGTCALCGCYVEARAAKKAMQCADVPPRWTRVTEKE